MLRPAAALATALPLVSACTGGGASPEPAPHVEQADPLFEHDTVRRVELTIPTDDGPPSTWDLLDAQAPATACEVIVREYYQGSAVIDGLAFPDVGLRTKGGCGSSLPLDEKASFKLHLSWDPDPTDDVCPKTRRYLGRKRLTLNNGLQDATAMHEHLTFQFYRMAGVPAPQTAAVEVYVNDEYYGLYQLIENIDRDFLRRRFNTDVGKGAMYEGAYSCDFITGNGDALRDGGCWEREFELDACSEPEPGDDLQWFEADGTTAQDPWKFARQLQENLTSIASPQAYYPAIRQWIDWDAFLTYWATSVVVVDWDNYTNFQNNFRFYHDPESDLWYWIPWGVDQTWQTRNPPSGGGVGPRFGRFSGPSHDAFAPRGDLARLCLDATSTDDAGQTCTEAYVAALWRALALFESVDWRRELDAWQARLTPYMQRADDKKSYGYEQWLENVDQLREFAATRAQALATELTAAGYPRP